MQVSILGSGSKGNSVFVQSGKTAILIDAGFSGKELKKRLATIGQELNKIRGICLTHEHNDHILGCGVISRQAKIEVIANAGTFSAADKQLGTLFSRREFSTGDSIELGDLLIRSFRISHDTADPVGYVIEDGKSCLGYCTDTGKVSMLILQRLLRCNTVILEFNHNLELLKNGPYPLPLQQRVRSSLGHLANEDAGTFLAKLAAGPMLRQVVLAHLSEINNRPELAEKAACDALVARDDVILHIASQSKATSLLTV
jgi:phosphoribosyl 1,2-cyclic phosphodiesterase